MTETPVIPDTAESELDFEDWLNGGERKAHYVALYGRADLYADIEQLQRQLVPVEEVHEDDAPMSGTDNPNAEIEARINELWVQMDASKRQFRVSARTKPELEALDAEVKAEYADAIDAAAADARKEALAQAKRLGVTAANEKNNMVRIAANRAANAIIEREVSLRAIAAGTTMEQRGEWIAITPEQLRRLEERVGESQMEALNRAYSRAAGEAPQVSLPK